MRWTASIMAVARLALGLAGFAVAGKHKPPATGQYVADLEVNGSYGQGVWAVDKDGGKRVMVAAPGYSGIYYPDPGKCDGYDVPISKTSVPLSKNGRFHVKETDTVPGTTTDIKVDWKGKWKSATKVVGTIELASGHCHSSDEFTAAKVAGT
jgi:hypothetical protein